MSTFQQRARTSRQARITEASIAGMATKGALISESRIGPTVGMAKCSSYLHFRSKADLIRASFEELESRVLAEYERRLADLSGEVAALDRLTLISLLNLDSSTGFFSRGVFTRLCMLENLRREDVTRRVEKLVASVLADGVSAGLRSGFPPPRP